MLVVGSRGSGAHAGTLIGSTSLELAEHARVPVTIAPVLLPERLNGLPERRKSGGRRRHRTTTTEQVAWRVQ